MVDSLRTMFLSFYFIFLNKVVAEMPMNASNSACQTGLVYSEGLTSRLLKGTFTNINIHDAHTIGRIKILFVRRENDKCCPDICLKDCLTGYEYNITLCDRVRDMHVNVTRSNEFPGNVYIITLYRTDSCSTDVGIAMYNSPVSATYTLQLSKQEAGNSVSPLQNTDSDSVFSWNKSQTIPTITLSTSLQLLVHGTLTTALPNTWQNKLFQHSTEEINFYTTGDESIYSSAIHPSSVGAPTSSPITMSTTPALMFSVSTISTDSINSSLVTKIDEVIPTRINWTIEPMLTSTVGFRNAARLSDCDVDYNWQSTPKTEKENDDSNVNETIALGVTVSLSSLAILIILGMIIRVLYKTKKDANTSADDSVFCSQDFSHTPGFINEAPSAVASPDFINIRRVSDSTTDEMMEIKEHSVSFNNKVFTDSYLGSNSKYPVSQKQGKTCIGPSSYRKYPAPQPSRASNYIANKNSRTYTSERDYFDYKK